MKKRNQTLKKKVLERDNFTSQKCKIYDKTAKILEAHHIIPFVFGGKDDLTNLITLCNDCHYYAPNKKEEFEEYMKEELNGTTTTFLKAWKLFLSKNPKLSKQNLDMEKNDKKN